MHNFRGEIQSSKISLMEVLGEIRLTNITEIKIIQEVVSFIDSQYKEYKSIIHPATVSALILNRQDINNLYATSSRGYNNQIMEFQNQFGMSGFQIREKLVPWAVDQVLRQGLSKNLSEDLARAMSTPNNRVPIDDANLLQVLANINLANVAEFQVMKGVCDYINTNYSQEIDQINLSDVCALVLNHESVSSMYATSAEEYDALKQIYIAENQPQVNEVIKKMIAKVYAEESKNSISHDSLVAVNFQRRKKLTKSWNI